MIIEKRNQSVQLPTSADNVALPATHRAHISKPANAARLAAVDRRPCSSRSTSSALRPGPQQQTRRSGVRRTNDSTDSQTNGRTDGRTPDSCIDPAAHSMRVVPTETFVVAHKCQPSSKVQAHDTDTTPVFSKCNTAL